MTTSGNEAQSTSSVDESPKAEKSPGTRGSFHDIAPSSLSIDEEIALASLRRYDPEFTSYNLYDTVIDYGGGVLVLAEIFKSDGVFEYQVHVKDGRGTVFTDFSQVVRRGQARSDFLSRMTSPNVVIAAVTLLLILSFIGFELSYRSTWTQYEAPQILGTAITTIIGYWFGRQSRAAEK